MKKKFCSGLLSLCLLISFVLTGCSTNTLSFDEFIENQFIEAMQSDYLAMHVYLENPEDYGIDVDEVVVEIATPYTEDAFQETQEEIESLREQFDQYDRDDLDEDQQTTYDCFDFYLTTMELLYQDEYEFIGSCFDSMSGDHVSIPTTLADLRISNEQDAEDLITLVISVKEYLEGDILYTQLQAEAGYLSVDFDSVIEKCDDIIDAGTDGSTLLAMEENIQALGLDEEVESDLLSRLEEAYVDYFIPAYEEVKACMEELQETYGDNEALGLSTYAYGSEYYEALFRYKTSTDKTIEEIQTQLEEDIEDAYMQLYLVYITDYEGYLAYYDVDIETGYSDYETMLSDLEEHIANDFPSVDELSYNIEAIPDDLVSSGVAAYYNIPALDSSVKKEIRVNETDNDIESLSTFTTLAHEGIPGHMYQIEYAYENVDVNWRLACGNFIGYTEGYATYVELYVLQYLDIDSTYTALEEILSIYQNSLVALMDIGIHYEGWSVDDLETFMESYGLSATSTQALYDQLLYNPGAFLSYYVGYSEIANLQEEAQEALGDAYSDLEFHEAILKDGEVPFTVVEANVQAYIDSYSEE